MSSTASSTENNSDDPDDDRQPMLKPSNMMASSSEEAAAVRKVLLAVQRHEHQRLQDGFNEINFSCGVLNSMLVAYVFGNFPEHFWLLWLVEAIALIPRKIYQDWHALPLRQILYYLDYCWIMTFVIVFSLYYILADSTHHTMSDEWRQQLYLTVLGVGCGPLLGATAAMPFVAMVFHDNKMMTSLFIHLTPAMLVYTFHWHSAEIKEAWPSFFHYSLTAGNKNSIIMEDVLVTNTTSADIPFYPSEKGLFFYPFQPGTLGTVAGNAMTLYAIWFVPYVAWMALVGLDLTRKQRRKKSRRTGEPLPTSQYDTAFHCILRDGMCETIGFVFGRSVEESRRQAAEGDYETRDFLLIMVAHALACWFSTMFSAYICLYDKRLHAAMLWVIVIITVFRGAQQYVAWVTSMTSKAVEAEFASILQDIQQESGGEMDHPNDNKLVAMSHQQKTKQN